MRSRIRRGFTALLIVSAFAVPSVAQVTLSEPIYVSPHQVWSAVQPALLTVGERLQKPGKERLIASGTVSIDQGQASPIQFVLELPSQVKVTTSRGTVTFDGRNPNETVPREASDSSLIETLIEDSVEGFFAAHRTGSNHFLGTGYRVRGSAKNSPAFSIMEVWTKGRFRGSLEPTGKQYWFDRGTNLLSRVVYRNGAGGAVEVVWSDWTDLQGEKVPLSVERKEGGRTVLTLRLASISVAPKVADGLFDGR